MFFAWGYQFEVVIFTKAFAMILVFLLLITAYAYLMVKTSTVTLKTEEINTPSGNWADNQDRVWPLYSIFITVAKYLINTYHFQSYFHQFVSLPINIFLTSAVSFTIYFIITVYLSI